MIYINNKLYIVLIYTFKFLFFFFFNFYLLINKILIIEYI